MSILTAMILMLATALIFLGFKLLRGEWQIPAEKRERHAILGIGGALLLGLINLALTINPSWRRRFIK